MTADPVSEHPELRTLEISMVLTAEPPTVRFTVLTGGRAIAELEVPADTIGVPIRLDEVRFESAEPRFQLPPAALEELRRALREKPESREEPVWLLLRRPWGYLPAVPWERLLQPGLGVPVFRFPFPSLPPLATADQLRMVVIASSPPQRKAVALADLVNEVVNQTARVAERMRVDVFTDARAFPGIVRSLARWTDRDGIRVHDPRGLRHGPPTVAADGGLAGPVDPWLRWVTDILGDESVDILQLIAPGYVSTNYGGLTLPESPVATGPDAPRGILGAADLIAFQRRTGAWLLGLTVAHPGVNCIGLRLLAHRTAEQWAGPVMLYDPYVDPSQGLELDHAYPWLLRRETSAPRTPALTLYCHPSSSVTSAQADGTRGGRWADASGSVRALLQDYTLAKGRTLELIDGFHPAPAWVAANQRALEQATASLREPSAAWGPSPMEQALRRGTEDALRFVSGVIERHAELPSSEPPPP